MVSKSQELTNKVNLAQVQQDASNDANAIKLYEEVVNYPLTSDDITEESIKAKEGATYKLATIYRDKGLFDELIDL
jgi:hypothetical protein